MQVESSLGGEFPLELPDHAIVTSMSTDKRPAPVRIDNQENSTFPFSRVRKP